MLKIFKKFNFFLIAFAFFNLELKADFIEIAPKYETPEIATSGDAAVILLYGLMPINLTNQ